MIDGLLRDIENIETGTRLLKYKPFPARRIAGCLKALLAGGNFDQPSVVKIS